MSNSPALDALTAAVAAEDSVVDSAVALLNGLAAQIRATAPNEAAIAQLANDVAAKSAGLAAAVQANTSALPAPAPAPAPVAPVAPAAPTT